MDAKLASKSVFDSRKSSTSYGEANVLVPEAIRAQLLQILIGNTNYILEIYNTRVGSSFYYNDLKNVALIRKEGQHELQPLIYDFDIASMVVGYENSAASKPWSHTPEITSDTVTMIMLKQLTLTREAEI